MMQTMQNDFQMLYAKNVLPYRLHYDCEYIAFGNWADSTVGPAICFDGGSPFSSVLENAPFLQFNIYGDCTVRKMMWMDKYNCPNAFNEKVLKQIEAFVQVNLPILYLVYARLLDKEDALAYFEGKLVLSALLASIYRIPDDLYYGLLACENKAQLHLFCVENGLYGADEITGDRSILCPALERELHREFEMTWYEGCTVEKYSGDRETVFVPDGVECIGEDAFRDHAEIKRIVFPYTLQSIADGAFSGCTGLEILLFPASVEYIGENAFAGCTQLRTVAFDLADPYFLMLDDGAFRGCENLTDVMLPNNVEFYSNPFPDCPALKLCCKSGTNLENLAKKCDIPYICTDEKE